MAQAKDKEISIPANVEVEVHNSVVKVTGPQGVLERDLFYPSVEIRADSNRVSITTTSSKKAQQSIVGTYASHIENMITGTNEGFYYKLKMVYSHFPIQVKVHGQNVAIENFLGERKPRVARIIGVSTVTIQGDEVLVAGPNKEHVGQTAANIEQATRIKGRDPRVFQDGIYLTEKGAGGG
ncbi:MAG: 50S ribosomal protein L6 [Euryarchaeota archaeon]|nr:50S ribosomal protein L6 [Euryarchaeota archaeon]